jgi:CheY-like chemotaxis protein
MAETRTESAGTERAFRVLIVDDNQDAADSLAVLARLWGCDARTAYDGHSGLAVARDFRPDCLVLDIGMPGIDGYALARRLRGDPSLAKTKLVALTAYGSDEDRRQALAAGFDHHLTKPANPEDLERLIRMLELALKIAERTEALAQQNVELARETKDLLTEVKEEIKEVKEEIRDVKEEIRDVKEMKQDRR